MFTSSAWTFVVPLVLIMVTTAIISSLTAPTTELQHHYHRVLVWTGVSAPLWVAGAALGFGSRLWLWGAAAATDLLGTWLAHPLPRRVLRSDALSFDAEHMLERLRRFSSCCSERPCLPSAEQSQRPPPTFRPCSPQSAYSRRSSASGPRTSAVARTSSPSTSRARPIRSERVRLLMNATYGVLAGLVALAVGSELAIAHPLDRDATIGPLLFGGPALYLAAQAWYFRVFTRRAWAERFVASVGLAIAGAMAIWLPALASVAILVGILAALVVILLRVHRRLTGTSTAALDSQGLARVG